MRDFVECKYCKGELRFLEQEPGATHKWRAECTVCTNKKKQARFNDWVSDAQMDEIAKLYPTTIIVPYK
jgi:hypothetical protein